MELFTAVALSIVANYLFGVVAHIGKDFSPSLAFAGFTEVIKRLIAASGIYWVHVYLLDFDIIGIGYSVVAWTILGYLGGYNFNSFLVNASKMSGLPELPLLSA